MKNRTTSSKKRPNETDANADEASPLKRARIEAAPSETKATLFHPETNNKKPKYIVLDNQTNLLKEVRVASLGTLRETILLDMESKELESEFQKFLGELPKPLEATQPLDEPLLEAPAAPEAHIDDDQLAYLNKFVWTRLSQIKFNKEQAENYQSNKIKELVVKPEFPLENFLQLGAGCCRHHVLFSAFLLIKLIQNKGLNAENCSVQICKVPTYKTKRIGNHAVVIFQVDSRKLFLDCNREKGLVLDISTPLTNSDDPRLVMIQNFYEKFDGVRFFNDVFAQYKPAQPALTIS